MISYKTPQADLEGKKGLFFEIGLVVSLLLVFLAFQIRTPIRTPSLIQNLSEFNIIEEEIFSTHQPPPPKELPRPQNITLLKVVEDNVEDVQQITIQVEVDQSTEIPVYTPVERISREEEEIKEEEIFLVVEEQPEFPGGDIARIRYFNEHITYPSLAREMDIQGTVYVGFVVEPDGSISNIKLLRGIGGGCDEEALRVVAEMPRWKPGKQRNKAVRVKFTLPVRFTLL
jgi:periplasmic protein TonB